VTFSTAAINSLKRNIFHTTAWSKPTCIIVIGSHHAGIVVRPQDCSRLIGDRIACRNITHVAREKSVTKTLEENRRYKAKVLEVLLKTAADPETGNELTKKFLNLAESLEHVKGVAIPAEFDMIDDSDEDVLRDAGRVMFHGDSTYSGRLLALSPPGLLQQHFIFQGLLHPLFVALLAYQMGGPINAANTAYAHQWKLPDQSLSDSDMKNFHMEGDNGDILIFDDHRITLVWEEHNGKPRGPSGKHHLFLSGQGSGAQPLKTASLMSSDKGKASSVILYDAKSSALVYECQDPEAVRHSISLDFHTHTMTDDVLDLLATSEPTTLDLESITLSDLLLSFPVSNYSNHFHRILFSPDSLQAIISKLSSIDISATQLIPLSPPATQQPFLQRLEDYKRDNHSHIPRDILSLEKDIFISGTYTSTSRFLEKLCQKARRDVHLPLGWDLVPQNPIEENREWARKIIRNLPGTLIHQRFAKQAPALTRVSYNTNDLLSTGQLQNLATGIEKRYLEVIGNGFIDESSVLPSMPSFVAALGSALNGPKEIQACAEPRVDEQDLQMYRTRSLYLFWCADWLENYLGEAIPGPFMIVKANSKEVEKMKGEMGLMARALLRNWAAWGCLMEVLPSGEFCIRQQR
jgi:hypothetical protein